jgi:hypothetical protein
VPAVSTWSWFSAVSGFLAIADNACVFVAQDLHKVRKVLD